jgi:hypothetical protein
MKEKKIVGMLVDTKVTNDYLEKVSDLKYSFIETFLYDKFFSYFNQEEIVTVLNSFEDLLEALTTVKNSLIAETSKKLSDYEESLLFEDEDFEDDERKRCL